MDDMLEQLSAFLSTDEGREQLKNVASMFGGENFGKEAPKDALASLGAGRDDGPQEAEKSPAPDLSGMLPDGLNLDMIMKLAPLIAKFNAKSDDKNSRLIMALKPHLKPENRHRADEAAQMLKLLSIFPSLKDFDLF